MMEDRVDNVGAAQNLLKYSNFTLDDKFLNLIGKMNNAVRLILHPFHPKGKMLCWGFELNSAPGAVETWGFKRPYLKIWKNMVMEYFNVHFLDLT